MERWLIASSILLWSVMLLNLLLTLALIRRLNRGEARVSMIGLEPGQSVPDFVAETLGGRKVTLADFERHTILLIFISPSCSACIENLPGYEALATKAKQDGIETTLISFANAEATQNLMEKYNLHLPVLFALENNPLREDYKIRGWPSFLLIDSKGKVQAAGYMPTDYDHWKKLAKFKLKEHLLLAPKYTS